MKGDIFEKVGVNISTVSGEFSEIFRKEIPGAAENPNYWASGISLVAHPRSPLVPAAHFNTRMICVGSGARIWFGGGGDLNPMGFPVDEDTHTFHQAFENACLPYHPGFFSAFSRWCDDYFYIPHRRRTRGVGGIFYDYLGLHHLGSDMEKINPAHFGKGDVGKQATQTAMQLAADALGDWKHCFAFTRSVGEAFRDIYPRLIAKRKAERWTAEQESVQLVYRGHYAEYNLLYDRGTRFGLMTGGNPQAILMSLPPRAEWP